jgi:hypothetical protein
MTICYCAPECLNAFERRTIEKNRPKGRFCLELGPVNGYGTVSRDEIAPAVDTKLLKLKCERYMR